MIPTNQLAHVIHIERERDLERWRRLRAAKAAMTPRPIGPGRMARLAAALVRPRRLGRPTPAVVGCDDHTAAAASAACC